MMEVKVQVAHIQLGATIPAERFTLKSMGLPTNTMINDYRLSRIVGYWNGEDISESPVYNKGQPPGTLSQEPPKTPE
jgi:hypothetical protein